MRSVATFLALSGSDRRLLLSALATIARVRIGLRLQSIERLKAWSQQAKAGEIPADRLSWAVQVAARRLPGTSCLASALALQRLLSQQGLVSELHIGVARQAGAFAAHAWLTHHGEILIGAEQHEDFTQLVAWPSNPA
ncbi:lasso peptide biosynthesis B2 protein [Reyranella massiliensis]|uniref:lasso peptide biosynthesis B2 protein n=1 Tax=Reyranella massiliensis TaxID=445220 RepID=UPI0006ACBAF7|nr:lasso peptide biosynthesis B2 protein [Reyranella massiliensis]